MLFQSRLEDLNDKQGTCGSISAQYNVEAEIYKGEI